MRFVVDVDTRSSKFVRKLKSVVPGLSGYYLRFGSEPLASTYLVSG